MFPVFVPNRLVFDRSIRLLSIRGVHRYPSSLRRRIYACRFGFVPGRMPFPVREFSRWKPRGTDGIVVQVPRSVVKYSNSDCNLQIISSQ